LRPSAKDDLTSAEGGHNIGDARTK